MHVINPVLLTSCPLPSPPPLQLLGAERSKSTAPFKALDFRTTEIAGLPIKLRQLFEENKVRALAACGYGGGAFGGGRL